MKHIIEILQHHNYKDSNFAAINNGELGRLVAEFGWA